jgi:hypothetical protein
MVSICDDMAWMAARWMTRSRDSVCWASKVTPAGMGACDSSRNSFRRARMRARLPPQSLMAFPAVRSSSSASSRCSSVTYSWRMRSAVAKASRSVF